MEDVRRVAHAYYARATDEEKEAADELFRSIDTNEDGKISLEEFKSPGRQDFTHDSVFYALDENGDGTLDSKEVVVLYYMQKCGMRTCKSCNYLMLGSYFSCLMCEKNYPQTYDICSSCYTDGKFTHDHSTDFFLDTRSKLTLLGKIMQGAQITLPDSEKMNQLSVQRSVSRSKSKRESVKEFLEGFAIGTHIGNTAVTIGHIAVVAGCSVM